MQAWKRIPDVEVNYWTAINSLEPSSQTLVFGCAILERLQVLKKDEQLSAMKTWMLESFIKLVVSTKVKPDGYLVEQCRPFLKRLTHDDFKGVLLPAILKAMLRSPEICLGSIGQIVDAVSLDLSPYAAELGKPIAACLHSKEDPIRDEAVAAVEALAKQCSDPAAIRSLVSLFFGVLQGSEGKLTVASHKMSVIDGIARLSKHCVTGAGVQQLSAEVSEHFVKILEAEVHEGTLTQALSALSLWTARLSAAVPKSLMEIFKKGGTLKTATPAVRTGYVRCMSASFHGESLSQGVELIPTLLKSLEKASAQPTQVPVVSEGLAAAALLLRIAEIDSKVRQSINLFSKDRIYEVVSISRRKVNVGRCGTSSWTRTSSSSSTKR